MGKLKAREINKRDAALPISFFLARPSVLEKPSREHWKAACCYSSVSLDQATVDALQRFVEKSNFAQLGGIITDLDGTALHEDAGRIYIPKPVELGLKKLHDLGRPFILNTLRFPLSVLRTFGRDWYGVSNSPIPIVTLNGSLLGYVIKTDNDEMAFAEIAAFPLPAGDVDGVLDRVAEMVDGGLKNLLLFYYPRDWKMGEIIWTPAADRVLHVKERYMSASSVTAVELSKLREQMHQEEICMIFLLVDVPHEQLMAYQHTQRSNFFTASGVDKLFGAQRMAEKFNLELGRSVGAGDTELDRFLKGAGLAVLVGSLQLEFKGLYETIRLKDSFELGDLLFRLAGMLNRGA
jgi:hydroxymethylpyrimidine pyrophosphatase-like HAD family hydrolase